MEAASSRKARPARRGGSAPPVSVVLLFRRLSQPPPSVWRFSFSRGRPGCRLGTFPPTLPAPGSRPASARRPRPPPLPEPPFHPANQRTGNQNRDAGPALPPADSQKPEESPSLVQALRQFTLRTAPSILTEGRGNRVYSPASLYEALAMLAEITGGNTRPKFSPRWGGTA